MKARGLSSLFPFEGHRLVELSFSSGAMQVILEPDRRRALQCPECGFRVSAGKWREQRAYDLPFASAGRVEIVYQARQGCCRLCGTWSTFVPPGISAPHRATRRLMRTASRLAAHLPVSRVGEFLGFHDTRIRRWDQTIMQEEMPAPDLNGLRCLLIDEKSVGKGHAYITIVMNALTGEVVHLAEGKRKDSLQAFFISLTRWQKEAIKAVVMDRSGAYYACVREELPHAAVVFDKFHLVQNFNAVVDEVRRTETQQAVEQKRPFIKGQRYNLLRRPENLTAKQQASLAELLQTNENLNKAYLLLDDFREVLAEKSVQRLSSSLKRWQRWARESDLNPVARFARNLTKSAEGIINIARWRISNGLIESFNNQVARVIRRACGYCDTEYLFLKIRQAAHPPKLSICAR